MYINEYARIGKGPLVKALGLQAPHKIERYVQQPDQIDESLSGCFQCPHYQQKQYIDYLPEQTQAEIKFVCNNCPSKIYRPSYKIVHQYINEKNRFGYKPRLKGNAIKLLLLYHFCDPYKTGLVKNLNISELAQKLKCTRKTILNCNAMLVKYNYIMINSIDRGYINVLLVDYPDYHKSAREGGTGYFSMSKDLLDQLINITDINQLRITLRVILEADKIDGSFREFDIRQSYSEIKRYLPDYCKRNTIQKAINKNNVILDATPTSNEVIFNIKTPYNPKIAKDNLAKLNDQLLHKYISDINDLLTKANNMTDSGRLEIETTTLKPIGIMPNLKQYMPINITDQDYTNLVDLSVRYSISAVYDAIITIYNNYIQQHKHINEFGALARVTIIKDIIHQHKNSSFIKAS